MVKNQMGTSRYTCLIPHTPYMQKMHGHVKTMCNTCAHGVLVLATNSLRISSYPKFWCVTFLSTNTDEVREWNVILAHAFRKGHVHVAMCTWRTWFEHVHIKEGPRDTGKKHIGILRLWGAKL